MRCLLRYLRGSRNGVDSLSHHAYISAYRRLLRCSSRHHMLSKSNTESSCTLMSCISISIAVRLIGAVAGISPKAWKRYIKTRYIGIHIQKVFRRVHRLLIDSTLVATCKLLASSVLYLWSTSAFPSSKSRRLIKIKSPTPIHILRWCFPRILPIREMLS